MMNADLVFYNPHLYVCLQFFYEHSIKHHQIYRLDLTTRYKEGQS